MKVEMKQIERTDDGREAAYAYRQREGGRRAATNGGREDKEIERRGEREHRLTQQTCSPGARPQTSPASNTKYATIALSEER